MIYRTTDMSKEELASQLLWALADPENRLFAKTHAPFIVDLLNYAVVHLSPQSAAKIAAENHRKEGVQAYASLIKVRDLLEKGWVAPKNKTLLPRFKGEDFDRYDVKSSPHCILSAAQGLRWSNAAQLIAAALGFHDIERMCSWEDMQTKESVIEALNQTILSYAGTLDSEIVEGIIR